MDTIKTWHKIGIAAAMALCIIMAPQLAGAQSTTQTETVVIKEKAVVSDTIVNPNMATPAQARVTPERPFETRREMLPAGSAVVGQGVISNEYGPDIVNYASSVASRTPNELVLNTVISKAEDDAVLNRLASKVYLENGGPAYDNVTIFWHIGDNPQPTDPWGRTDIRKGATEFKVVRIQQ